VFKNSVKTDSLKGSKIMAIEGKKIIRPYAPIIEPLPIPTSAWNNAPQWCLSVNEHWGAYILAVLEILGQRDTWIGDTAEIDAVLNEVDQLIDAFIHGECGGEMAQVYPDAIFLTLDCFHVNQGLSPEIAIDTAAVDNNWMWQPSQALDDELVAQIPLAAGDYILSGVYQKRPSGGIVSFYLDDVLVGAIDQYNSSVLRNLIMTNIMNVTSTGQHELKIKVTGKNASSSGYYSRWSRITISRYA